MYFLIHTYVLAHLAMTVQPMGSCLLLISPPGQHLSWQGVTLSGRSRSTPAKGALKKTPAKGDGVTSRLAAGSTKEKPARHRRRQPSHGVGGDKAGVS
jgi:hypothetical protein